MPATLRRLRPRSSNDRAPDTVMSEHIEPARGLGRKRHPDRTNTRDMPQRQQHPFSFNRASQLMPLRRDGQTHPIWPAPEFRRAKASAHHALGRDVTRHKFPDKPRPGRLGAASGRSTHVGCLGKQGLGVLTTEVGDSWLGLDVGEDLRVRCEATTHSHLSDRRSSCPMLMPP